MKSLVPQRLIIIGCSLLITLLLFVGISIAIIDRGEPVIDGTITDLELKALRHAVRRSALDFCLYLFTHDNVSAACDFTAELYTYRIVKIEVEGDEARIITNLGNGIFGHFAAIRINGVWTAAPNVPIM